MAKYTKFADYLEQAKSDVLHLTFDEIEAIIGSPLPASKAYPAWWSNNPWNNVMTRVWLDAGFKSSRVDVVAGTVDFVRVRTESKQIDALGGSGKDTASEAPIPRSPLFGFMKGTTIVAPGVDLTEPADPDWAHVYDESYVPASAQDVVGDPSLSISDKIRELDALGISRAQIAKLLNKRYQHVRNVLVADQRKAG